MKIFLVMLLVPILSSASQSLGVEQFPEALQKSAYYEQKLIGIRDTTQDTMDSRYQPEQGLVFEVPTFWVDQDLYEIRVDEKAMPPEIKKLFFREHQGQRQILISVHPDGFDYFPEIISKAQKGKPFISTASASPRSLITVAEDHGAQVGFYNKLSLNKRLGGNVRMIHKVELARSYFVTQLLSGEANLPSNFGFYSEFMVMIPKGQDKGGTIIRSLPKEVLSGEVTHIPFFALYAAKPDGSKPLIVEMAEKVHRPVDEYFKSQMIEPFLKQWMDLALDHGISMEPHGQNLLLEVDRAGHPTGRFIHRDFGGFTVNLELRNRLGLKTPALPEINGYRVKYDDGDVGYGYETSIDLYFANIVVNFAHRYQEWKQKGWVDKDVSVDEYYQELIKSVEKAYFNKTGQVLNLEGKLKNLKTPMFEAGYRQKMSCARLFQ